MRPGDPESLGDLMAALDRSVAEAQQARARYRGATIVEAAVAKLAELDPGHEWDVAAGHPHDNRENAYVIRGARLGPGAQPFLTIWPGYIDDMFPEMWTHLGNVAAHGFHNAGLDHDDPQRVIDRAALHELPRRLRAWSAHHAL